jgi:NMT1/THI5 like
VAMLGSAHREPTEMFARAICKFPHFRSQTNHGKQAPGPALRAESQCAWQQPKGKTVVLSSVAAQAVCNTLLTQAGVDTSEINYIEAGNGWAQSLMQCQADSALSWEGLRAQWKSQGLDFDYILGRNFSRFPALGFVIRRADFQEAAKRRVYAQ